MNVASTVLLSLAMSTDAFAAAIGKGTALQKPRWSEALRTGAIFGSIEAATPVVGWLIGAVASRHVASAGPWIAFVLLAVLGGRMVWEGLKRDPDDEDEAPRERHSFLALALTGLATSIDAMAVGLGLALVDVAIVPVALCIGFTTFVAVSLGVMLGRWLGSIIGHRAEVAGGVVLAGIGAAILWQHLSAQAIPAAS